MSRAPRNYALCSVEECGKPANRVGAGLCEAHYARVRRHGSTDRVSRVKPGSLVHTAGYLLIRAPGHSLDRGGGRVYEHRAVFFEAHGEGPFACHWCRNEITWDDLHVDHVNESVTDNSLSNLVASCAICNQARGLEKMRRTKRLQSTRRYTAHGKTMCIAEWSRELGISRNAIEFRIKAGWPIEKVFSPRIGLSGPKSRQ